MVMLPQGSNSCAKHTPLADRRERRCTKKGGDGLLRLPLLAAWCLIVSSLICGEEAQVVLVVRTNLHAAEEHTAAMPHKSSASPTQMPSHSTQQQYESSSHTVAQQVADAINAFLDPLGGGGEGREQGWPFGQDLHPTCLCREILEVADVVAVPRLALLVNGRPHDDLSQPVVVPPDGLLYGAAEHQITVIPANFGGD
jgi:hypothetical protein